VCVCVCIYIYIYIYIYVYVYIYVYTPYTIVNLNLFHNLCVWGKTMNRMSSRYVMELREQQCGRSLLFGFLAPVSCRVIIRLF